MLWIIKIRTTLLIDRTIKSLGTSGLINFLVDLN